MRKFMLNAPELLVPKRFLRTYSEEHHSDGHDKACWCAICDKAVDRELIEDVGNKRMEIRVWHHGAEDARRLDWESDSEDLATAMERVRNQPFFVPAGLDQTSNVRELGDSNA